MLHSEATPDVPSECLEFDKSGREKPKSRSISENELWRRIGRAEKRKVGEGIPE